MGGLSVISGTFYRICPSLHAAKYLAMYIHVVCNLKLPVSYNFKVSFYIAAKRVWLATECSNKMAPGVSALIFNIAACNQGSMYLELQIWGTS